MITACDNARTITTQKRGKIRAYRASEDIAITCARGIIVKYTSMVSECKAIDERQRDLHLTE